MGPDDEDDDLVTVAVTPVAAAPSALSTPAATSAPVPPETPVARAHPLPVQMPDGWTLHKVASLVGDVAQNMYDMPYILKKHELTPAQYKSLEANPFFQRALEAEIITWQGANSIQKRLALEAAIASEAAMPALAARLQNRNESLADIVPLMKLFAEMAGTIGNKNTTAGMGNADRVRITINLGGPETLKKDASVVIDQQAIAAL